MPDVTPAAHLTPYQTKYYAYQLTRRCPTDSLEKLAGALVDAQVDLNPHQVEAALFAFRSPLSRGAILEDEVGLGKTIEAGLVLSQRWAERKRRILIITPANLRKQWYQELDLGARGGVERLDRMVGLAQRCEHLRAQGAPACACRGSGAASGHPFDVERRDQLPKDSLFDARRQVQCRDLLLDGGEEEGERRQQHGGQALGFGRMRLRSRRQVSRLGDRFKLLPDPFQASGQALGRLRLGPLQVVGVIRLAEGTDQRARLALAGLRLIARDGGTGQRGECVADALCKCRRTPWALALRAIRLLGRTRVLKLRLGGRDLGVGRTHRARQRQAGRLGDLVLEMQQVRGMMRRIVALDRPAQRRRLVARALDDRDRQARAGGAQGLRPSRGRAVRGVLLQHDEARHRLHDHQADFRMEGLVLAHRHHARRHARGQRHALLGGTFHHRLLQGRVQPLLAAVRGADERRQATELQALTDQAHTAAGAQGDDHVQRQDEPMQPLHPLLGGDERGQCHRHLGRRHVRPRPVPQGAARAPEGGGHGALALSRRPTGPLCPERLRPLQARGGLHRAAAGEAVLTRLKSQLAGPSNIFLDPRLVCTSNGKKFPRFYHLPLYLSAELGFGRSYEQGQQDVFSTPEPEKLVWRILQLVTKPNELVLDSFAGSGTTGAVAHKMGRRWIMVELGEHFDTHIVPRMKKGIDGQDLGGITKAVAWKGGGGFRNYRLAPSLLEKDRWGNWVINTDYNPAMLAEAVCKLEGFVYAPSETLYWQHGYSTETDFIFVTTQTLTYEQLQSLSDEVGEHRSLLVCCSAFRAKRDAFSNLTLKKIPKGVMERCEWGHDDYSLRVENLPRAPQEPEQAAFGLGGKEEET